MISAATEMHKNIVILGVRSEENIMQEEPGERYESHTDYSIAND